MNDSYIIGTQVSLLISLEMIKNVYILDILAMYLQSFLWPIWASNSVDDKFWAENFFDACMMLKVNVMSN